MFLFCVLSDLMYLCDCIDIKRTVKIGCYVIADSSIWEHFSTVQLELISD